MPCGAPKWVECAISIHSNRNSVYGEPCQTAILGKPGNPAVLEICGASNPKLHIYIYKQHKVKHDGGIQHSEYILSVERQKSGKSLRTAFSVARFRSERSLVECFLLEQPVNYYECCFSEGLLFRQGRHEECPQVDTAVPVLSAREQHVS